MNHTRLAVVALLAIGFAPVAAQDWPQWRGPARDGAIRPFREPAAWPAMLNKRWNVDVGTGYATPLVVGDRLYVFSRQGDNEVMTAFDAASAKVLWRTSYPAPFKMNPATAPHGPGPKSTPTFAANRLFTLGISGIVTAFDADDGQADLAETRRSCRAAVPHGDVAARRRQLVILHVGGHDNGALTSFDAATGAVAGAGMVTARRTGRRCCSICRHTPGRDLHAEVLRRGLARRWKASLASSVHHAEHDDEPDADPIQGHGDRDGTRQWRDCVSRDARRRQVDDDKRLAHR